MDGRSPFDFIHGKPVNFIFRRQDIERRIKELDFSNVRPTLKDAVAGDITAALPYRSLTNILGFIHEKHINLLYSHYKRHRHKSS